MTTSGTYIFSPSLGDMVLAAYRRCGVHATQITAQHILDARDAGVPAFFASYAATYGSVAVLTVLDAKGAVVTPATTRPATMDEEFRAFASGLSRAIADNVTSWMKARDAKIATDKVAPVAITPIP